jgi:hypothetical protein
MPDKDFLQWLSKHGEKEWGYVVYRTIYDDDEKWQRFLDALQAFIEYESDDEVVEMLNWIVMDDKEAFDGASVDAVRKYVVISLSPARPCLLTFGTDTFVRGSKNRAWAKVMEPAMKHASSPTLPRSTRSWRLRFQQSRTITSWTTAVT